MKLDAADLNTHRARSYATWRISRQRNVDVSLEVRVRLGPDLEAIAMEELEALGSLTDEEQNRWVGYAKQFQNLVKQPWRFHHNQLRKLLPRPSFSLDG